MKRLILILTFLLIFSGIALAQDATAEVTLEPTAVSTPVVGGVTVINNPTDTATEETPPATEPAPWYAPYVAFIVAFLVGGRGVLSMFNKWIEARIHDRAFITRGEVVGGFVPSPVKGYIRSLRDEARRAGKNINEYLDEVLDDTPYVTKPTSGAATTVDDGGDHVTRSQG